MDIRLCDVSFFQIAISYRNIRNEEVGLMPSNTASIPEVRHLVDFNIISNFINAYPEARYVYLLIFAQEAPLQIFQILSAYPGHKSRFNQLKEKAVTATQQITIKNLVTDIVQKASDQSVVSRPRNSDTNSPQLYSHILQYALIVDSTHVPYHHSWYTLIIYYQWTNHPYISQSHKHQLFI